MSTGVQKQPHSPEILPRSPHFVNRYSTPGGGEWEGGEPHFIRPGEITMTIEVATPVLLFTLPRARADKPLPSGIQACAAAPLSHGIPGRLPWEGALPITERPRRPREQAAPLPAPGTLSGKGGRAGGAPGARGAGRETESTEAREGAGFGGTARATRSFLSSMKMTTLSILRKITRNNSVGGGGVVGRRRHLSNHIKKNFLNVPAVPRKNKVQMRFLVCSIVICGLGRMFVPR